MAINSTINWIRPQTTQTIPIFNDGRPYQLEFPLLRASCRGLDYSADNALAVVIPVFLSETYGGLLHPYTAYTFHGFCKNALWLARELWAYTDAETEQVPIFIAVSENGLDVFEDYRTLCDFPLNRVLEIPFKTYHSRWRPRWPSQWAQKWDGIRHEALRPFERVLHCDASNRIIHDATLEATPCFANILTAWDSPETQWLALLDDGWRDREESLHAGMQLECQWCVDDSATFEEFWWELSEILGTSPGDEQDYWIDNPESYYPVGSFFGMSAYLRYQHEPRELFRKLTHFLAMDESVLGCVMKAYDIQGEKRVSLMDALPLRPSPLTLSEQPDLTAASFCYMRRLQKITEPEQQQMLAWWKTFETHCQPWSESST